MKKLIAIMTVVGLATSASVLAGEHAGKHRHGKHLKRGGMMHLSKKRLKELNLTPEQEERIESIRKEGRGKLKAQRAGMKEARQEMKKLLQSDSASRKDLEAAFRKSQEKRAEIARLRFMQLLDIRDVLTPEQRKKALELRQQAGYAIESEDDEE